MNAVAPVRVLVADDSAFMRKMVGDILRKAGCDVVATATDGVDALDKARSLRPDVITLDVEMPRMDGVAFLKALMAEIPTPVIMLSSLTDAGTSITIQCLELGAVDCIHKPSGSISLDIEKIGADIVAKVQAAARVDIRRIKPTLPSTRKVEPAQPRLAPPTASSGHFAPGREPVVIIASSTGGPAALNHVVPKLPGDIGASFAIVQHLPVGFTKSLADRLDSASALMVREAEQGDSLHRGVVLVAPAGRHMAFDSNGKVNLTDEPPLWGVRPAADVTLRTAADRFGSRLVVAVLTGMGRDGALGAKSVMQAGGVCYGQDEASCVVFGMPRAAHELGGIKKLVPITEMARVIQEAVAALHEPAVR